MFLLISFRNYFMALELCHCRRHHSVCIHGFSDEERIW